MKPTKFTIVILFIGIFGIQAFAQTPESLDWRSGPALPNPRAESAAVLALDNAILVLGGSGATIGRAVSKLGPGESIWESAPDLDAERSSPGVVPFGSNGILVMGGAAARLRMQFLLTITVSVTVRMLQS